MSPRQRKKWSELTRTRRRAIVAAAAVQFVLQALALWDVRRRPTDELKGSRAWWTVATFVNIVGPIAYFAVGRRRPVGTGGHGDHRPGSSETFGRCPRRRAGRVLDGVAGGGTSRAPGSWRFRQRRARIRGPALPDARRMPGRRGAPGTGGREGGGAPGHPVYRLAFADPIVGQHH